MFSGELLDDWKIEMRDGALSQLYSLRRIQSLRISCLPFASTLADASLYLRTAKMNYTFIACLFCRKHSMCWLEARRFPSKAIETMHYRSIRLERWLCMADLIGDNLWWAVRVRSIASLRASPQLLIWLNKNSESLKREQSLIWMRWVFLVTVLVLVHSVRIIGHLE